MSKPFSTLIATTINGVKIYVSDKKDLNSFVLWLTDLPLNDQVDVLCIVEKTTLTNSRMKQHNVDFQSSLETNLKFLIKKSKEKDFAKELCDAQLFTSIDRIRHATKMILS